MYKRRRKSSKGTEASLRRQSHSSPPLTPDDQLEEPLHHDSPRLRAARIETPPLPPLPPFLSLPFEIRQQIYNLCLIGKPAHPFTWPAGHSNPHIQPQLLGVCKQIHLEAAKILYTKNRFSFHHPSDCCVFTHIMDPKLAGSLTSVIFRLRDREADVMLWTEYFSSLSTQRSLSWNLPHLSSVLIFLNQGWPQTLAPVDAYRKWHSNKALRELCKSLQRQAEQGLNVSIVCSVRCQEGLFEQLRRELVGPEPGRGLLVEHARGWLRSAQLFSCMGSKVMLEIQGPQFAPGQLSDTFKDYSRVPTGA